MKNEKKWQVAFAILTFVFLAIFLGLIFLSGMFDIKEIDKDTCSVEISDNVPLSEVMEVSNMIYKVCDGKAILFKEGELNGEG